jgi:hypothetical protein
MMSTCCLDFVKSQTSTIHHNQMLSMIILVAKILCMIHITSSFLSAMSKCDIDIGSYY